jgi:polyisoprenoid-binding protein YceI
MPQPLDHHTTTIAPARSDPALPLPAGRWVADAASSRISFVARHFGPFKVRGRFHRFAATLDIGHSLAEVEVTAEVDLSSVETANAQRDGHLRRSELLAADAQPAVVFRATSLAVDGDTFSLDGDLTIGGVCRSVTLDGELTGVAVRPDDRRMCARFSAGGLIRRSAFGTDFGLGAAKVFVGDKIEVELDVQFVASEAG